MSKKNDSIKLNKNEYWAETAKSLKLWEIRLIEMRNAGEGYNEIRDALQKEFPRQKKGFKTNQHLRQLLFYKGRLYSAYIIYSEMIAEESLEQGQLIIKNLHKRAAMTVGNLLNVSVADNVRLSAANSVLDRNAGKATRSIEIADSSEMEELRQQVDKLSEANENITRLSQRIKNSRKRTSTSKANS